ncbi:MAG: prolyl oligopeptidase family serine peptidase [Verrucomicrobiales bacterium]|nr:prolyl oligopeptidase family serine peptidase [Verrucomicrobiales bacterium]
MKLTTLIVLAPILACAEPRTWTSSDGRQITAEYVSSTATGVSIKLPDGRSFTLGFDKLSPEDQAWVKERAQQPGKPVEGPYADLLTGDWALSQKGNLPFALFGATNLDAGKKYPLVLALHGRSQNAENGKQVGGWMKSFTDPTAQEAHPCIVVAPLGYQPYGGEGTAWNNPPGMEAIELVEDLIKNLPIDEDRVYAVGYSMGGFGTCHLMNTHPKLFAAGVAVAGCTDPSSAPTFKKSPIWLHHAADDPRVEVAYSRNLAEALKREKDCRYTEYDTGGHGIVGQVFANPEVHEWLFRFGVKEAK